MGDGNKFTSKVAACPISGGPGAGPGLPHHYLRSVVTLAAIKVRGKTTATAEQARKAAPGGKNAGRLPQSSERGSMVSDPGPTGRGDDPPP